MQNHIRLNILGENLKGKAWGLKVLMPYLSPATTTELNELNATFKNTISLVAFLFELDEEINSIRYALIPIDHESLPEEYRYKG